MSILTKLNWVAITCVYALAAYFLYCVIGLLFLFTEAEADTVKIGEGPFVMAVSYTDSYDDLQYVANFSSCIEAEKYYYINCSQATIMMCQLEDKLYMPIDHDSTNEFSSFDFEIDTRQSCGFVGVQQPKFTKD